MIATSTVAKAIAAGVAAVGGLELWKHFHPQLQSLRHIGASGAPIQVVVPVVSTPAKPSVAAAPLPPNNGTAATFTPPPATPAGTLGLEPTVITPSGAANLSIDSVSDVQNALTTLGVAKITADGKPGPLTATAVSTFQAAHGLPSTGIIDPPLKAALQAALASLAGTQKHIGQSLPVQAAAVGASTPDSPLGASIVSSGLHKIVALFQSLFHSDVGAEAADLPKTDDHKAALIKLQRVLNLLGASPPLDEGGTMTPETTAAIKAFQVTYGLVADGVPLQKTVAAMALAVDPAAQAAILPSVPKAADHVAGLAATEDHLSLIKAPLSQAASVLQVVAAAPVQTDSQLHASTAAAHAATAASASELAVATPLAAAAHALATAAATPTPDPAALSAAAAHVANASAACTGSSCPSLQAASDHLSAAASAPNAADAGEHLAAAATHLSNAAGGTPAAGATAGFGWAGFGGPGGDRLMPGERLRKGESLYSPDRSVHLDMQGDGNLVLYQGPGSAQVLWAASTGPGRQAEYAEMQTDGNFVVYTHGRQPLWASNTVGNSGAHLRIHGSGVLCVVANGQGIWIVPPGSAYPNLSGGQPPSGGGGWGLPQPPQPPMGGGPNMAAYYANRAQSFAQGAAAQLDPSLLGAMASGEFDGMTAGFGWDFGPWAKRVSSFWPWRKRLHPAYAPPVPGVLAAQVAVANQAMPQGSAPLAPPPPVAPAPVQDIAPPQPPAPYAPQYAPQYAAPPPAAQPAWWDPSRYFRHEEHQAIRAEDAHILARDARLGISPTNLIPLPSGQPFFPHGESDFLGHRPAIGFDVQSYVGSQRPPFGFGSESKLPSNRPPFGYDADSYVHSERPVFGIIERFMQRAEITPTAVQGAPPPPAGHANAQDYWRARNASLGQNGWDDRYDRHHYNRYGAQNPWSGQAPQPAMPIPTQQGPFMPQASDPNAVNQYQDPNAGMNPAVDSAMASGDVGRELGELS
jgi:peptidoglycan hydrolase-like protein with peptidoglycan-binding domain